MTPYIEAKKAEVRELLKGRGYKEDWQSTDRVMGIDAVEDFCEELIDTLLDEIESIVSFEKESGDDFLDPNATSEDNFNNGYSRGWNNAIRKTTRLFQHLRTGVAE